MLQTCSSYKTVIMFLQYSITPQLFFTSRTITKVKLPVTFIVILLSYFRKFTQF